MEDHVSSPRDLAARLRNLRSAVGLTQSDLAARARVHRTVIARAEQSGIVRHASLRQICRALRFPTSMSDLPYLGPPPFRFDRAAEGLWLPSMPSPARKKGHFRPESLRDENERRRIGLLGLAHTIARCLNIDLPGGRMWAVVVESYRKEHEAIAGFGQVVLYVLAGRIAFKLGNEPPVELGQGDVVTFWNDIPSMYESIGDAPSVVLEVYGLYSPEEMAERDYYKTIDVDGPDDLRHRAARFRSMRRALGWQQGEVAQKAGVHRTLVSRLEHSGIARVRSLQALAQAMGAPASWFQQPYLAKSPMRVERLSSARWLATLSSKVRRKNLYGPESFKSPTERARLAKIQWADGFVRLLNLDLPGGRMLALEIELFQPVTSAIFQGECVVYMLEGKAIITYEGQEIELEQGDTFSFWNDVSFQFRPAPGHHCRYLEVSFSHSEKTLLARKNLGFDGNSYLLNPVDQVQ